MITQKKEKPCRGISKAKGYGCGEIKMIHRYGLCLSCFAKWLYNTDEGSELIRNSVFGAKKKIERNKRIEHKQNKESIKKKSEFEKDLQTEINAIVRLLDVDRGCISCDHGWNKEWTRQAHAGHYYSVGSDPTLRFNLFNIWKQCSICNNWKSGNERAYANGIKKIYGGMMLLKITGLKKAYKALHLSKEELKEKIIIARQIKRRIMNGETITREQINQELKIYL